MIENGFRRGWKMCLIMAPEDLKWLRLLESWVVVVVLNDELRLTVRIVNTTPL